MFDVSVSATETTLAKRVCPSPDDAVQLIRTGLEDDAPPMVPKSMEVTGVSLEDAEAWCTIFSTAEPAPAPLLVTTTLRM